MGSLKGNKKIFWIDENKEYQMWVVNKSVREIAVGGKYSIKSLCLKWISSHFHKWGRKRANPKTKQKKGNNR
jgi:hypothetical protein